MSDRLEEIRHRAELLSSIQPVQTRGDGLATADSMIVQVAKDALWLGSEVERLRGALARYADENNWRVYTGGDPIPACGLVEWLQEVNPWGVARAALDGGDL
jgi:hypothetical protein